MKNSRKIHKNYNHNQDNINININRKALNKYFNPFEYNSDDLWTGHSYLIWTVAHTHTHTHVYYICWMCLRERVSVIWRSACACIWVCVIFTWSNTIEIPMALLSLCRWQISPASRSHTRSCYLKVFFGLIFWFYISDRISCCCAIFSILLVLFQSTVHNVTIWYLIRSMWCCHFYCYTDGVLCCVMFCSFMLFSV